MSRYRDPRITQETRRACRAARRAVEEMGCDVRGDFIDAEWMQALWERGCGMPPFQHYPERPAIPGVPLALAFHNREFANRPPLWVYGNNEYTQSVLVDASRGPVQAEAARQCVRRLLADTTHPRVAVAAWLDECGEVHYTAATAPVTVSRLAKVTMGTVDGSTAA